MKQLALLALLGGCLTPPAAPGGPERAWTRVADGALPGRMHGARLTWDPQRDAIVMYTGYNATQNLAPGYVYKWQANEWMRICEEGVGPPPLYLPGFTWEPSGQLVLVGGAQIVPGAGLFDNVSKDIYTCDTTGVWTKQTNTLQRERAGASLIYDPQRDRLMLVGGRDRNGPIKNAEMSAPNAQDFTIHPAQMPFASAGAGQTAMYDADSKMIFALEGETTGDDDTPLHDAIWTYDGAAWTRFCNDCSGAPRADASIVHIHGTNETYVIAGFAGNSRDHAGTWVIDQNKLLRVFDEPDARASVGAAYSDTTDSIVMFGGTSVNCEEYECDATFELSIQPQ
ncbi:MAG TPA: hypothetical protein VMZ53_10940 [Kofleriaceae bacterium]|nr:hypothetical protein [Kofleriaceae bacterium]